MIRPLGRLSWRAVAVVGGLVLIGATWGATAAAAAVPKVNPVVAGRVTTTTLPPTTTTVAVTTTQASPVTTLPQASTDTTPSARKSGTVAADPAQKRLRLIIGGLVGLAVIILFATVWFWRATSPARRVTVTDLAPLGEPESSEPGASGPEPWPEAVAHQGVPATSPAALPVMSVTGPLPTSLAAAPAVAASVAPMAPPRPAPLPASPAAHPMAEPSARPPVIIPPPSPSDPDPPSFAGSEPTQVVPKVEPSQIEPAPVADAAADDSVADGVATDDEEAWEPRLPEPPSGDGEWRGIRPLGPLPRLGTRGQPMADSLDLDAMVQRFHERAGAVKKRQLPPVEGEQRKEFIRQAQLDFQDFAMIGDAEASVEDGVVVLRIDLRPPDQRS